jgi:hypothetical protein
MRNQLSTCAAAFLLLASFAATACDRETDITTSAIAGPSALAAASLTAEPAVVSAEPRPGYSCGTGVAFDLSLAFTLRSRDNVFLRGFGFEFLDPFGRRVRPFVFPGPIEVNNSVVPPIPLPTTHPVPFPGEAKMTSVAARPGTFFRVPVRLQFDCDVSARGTLLVSAETADERGTVAVSRVSAEIR